MRPIFPCFTRKITSQYCLPCSNFFGKTHSAGAQEASFIILTEVLQRRWWYSFKLIGYNSSKVFELPKMTSLKVIFQTRKEKNHQDTSQAN